MLNCSTSSRRLDGRRSALSEFTRWLTRAVPAGAAALLVACGGGGGGGGGNDPVGPPSAAGTLSATTVEAEGSAKAAASVADDAAARANSLGSLGALFGVPIGSQASPSAARQRPLITETATCAEILDPPCSGSATLNTNLPNNPTSIPAGSYFDLTFNSLSGTLFGDSWTFNGRVRFEFLNSISNSSNLDGVDLLVNFYSLRGSVNHEPFGPFTDAARVQIDVGGNTTLTAGGARYTDLSGVSVTGPGDYSISSAHVRIAHWPDNATYVDITLSNWHVVGGRPTVGSTASVTAATGSATLRVATTSANTVVYDFAITVGGTTTHYTVTATYPVGGGTPTYVAVLSAPA
jgi:hypothetical protein